MKKKYIYLLVAVVFALNCLQAQDTTKIWINSYGERADKEAAPYYQLGWQAEGKWQVETHFRYGLLEHTGQYTDSTCAVKSGKFIFYSKEGIVLEEKRYKSNTLVGVYTKWYDGSTIDTKGQYSENVAKKEAVEIDYWEPQEPVFEDLAESVAPPEDDGMKVGRWEYYHPNGRLSAVEQFDSIGYLRTAEFYDTDGNLEYYGLAPEEKPQFPGGKDSLMYFLWRTLDYPIDDRMYGRSGKVVVSFVVDRDGALVDPQIERSASPSMDMEMLHALRAMPKWIPGIDHNRTVASRYYLPMRFTNLTPKGVRKMKRKVENGE